MTREEKKLYLNQYLDLKKQIDILTEEYHFWEETSKSVPIAKLELSGIHGSRKKSEPITKHIDICIKIAEIQEQAKDKLIEILDVINELESPEQKAVLEYRYINDLYFHEIADKMGYSLQHVYKIHASGLENIRVNAN